MPLTPFVNLEKFTEAHADAFSLLKDILRRQIQIMAQTEVLCGKHLVSHLLCSVP